MALLRLSDVKRRQRRAAALWLVVLLSWVASVFAVIALVRPLMVAKSPWYGLLILVYLFVSMVIVGYGIGWILRRLKLRCPYCGAAFVHVEVRGRTRDAFAGEDERRCDSCHAIILDLEA